MTTGKTIALAIQTFVGKVMSLHFNMLSRLVIVFLPRNIFFCVHIYTCACMCVVTLVMFDSVQPILCTIACTGSSVHGILMF